MKNSRSIDVVTKYFHPVAAGIETNLIETYSVLAKSGWSVTIHTSSSTLSEKNILPANETIRGIKVVRYPEQLFGYIPKIDYLQTNLICLHNFNIFPHGPILLKSLIHKFFGFRNYGIFLTPHGGFTPEWPMFNFISGKLKYLYHKTLGLILINTTVDGVRAISNWENDALINAGIMPELVTLIENGLDPVAKKNHEKLVTPKLKKMVNSLGDYVVAIGRISPIKNYETMIKAISKVSSIKLVIIGPTQDYKYQHMLKLLAAKLGISNRIILLGVIRGSDKYYLVKHSKAFVHMARWESFCNVVYEAMSSGKICIVADNTALSSLIANQKTGIVIPTYDSNALAEALKKHVGQGNKQLNNLIIQNINQLNFPIWSQTAGKMSSVYKRIIHKYEKHT